MNLNRLIGKVGETLGGIATNASKIAKKVKNTPGVESFVSDVVTKIASSVDENIPTAINKVKNVAGKAINDLTEQAPVQAIAKKAAENSTQRSKPRNLYKPGARNMRQNYATKMRATAKNKKGRGISNDEIKRSWNDHVVKPYYGNKKVRKHYDGIMKETSKNETPIPIQLNTKKKLKGKKHTNAVSREKINHIETNKGSGFFNTVKGNVKTVNDISNVKDTMLGRIDQYTGIPSFAKALSEEGSTFTSAAKKAGYYSTRMEDGKEVVDKLNYTKIAGAYMGASAVARVASGGGIYKDGGGNKNIVGLPFI